MADSTVPETAGIRRGSQGGSTRHLGLAVIWCPKQPQLLASFLPVRTGTWVFGRGHARDDDPFPRLVAIRQRPGSNVDVAPAALEAISRVQLLVSADRGDSPLRVERKGRCSVRINGAEAERGELLPGDVLEVGSQISFVCVERAERFAGQPSLAHAFGTPDARGIVGESEATWNLRGQLSFVAPRKEHVFVHGQSGAGKELVARALHSLSGRNGPLVSRSAATIPEALVDAELFGNAPSYPNPGMRERKGLVGTADEGTLFLDEFADLPESGQTHLLRVLDAGEYQRLGETQLRTSSLRLVAATNRAVETLREDVYARFTFHVEVPSLSQRLEDIPLLTRHLVLEIAGSDPAIAERLVDEAGEPRIAQSLMTSLVRNPPSGNVRDLRSYLWRGVAESSGTLLEGPKTEWRPSAAPPTEAADEGRRIREALDQCGGSLEETWRALGLPSRFALMRRMKKHGIAVSRRASRSVDGD